MKKKELPIGLTDKMLLKDINPFKFIGKVRDPLLDDVLMDVVSESFQRDISDMQNADHDEFERAFRNPALKAFHLECSNGRVFDFHPVSWFENLMHKSSGLEDGVVMHAYYQDKEHCAFVGLVGYGMVKKKKEVQFITSVVYLHPQFSMRTTRSQLDKEIDDAVFLYLMAQHMFVHRPVEIHEIERHITADATDKIAEEDKPYVYKEKNRVRLVKVIRLGVQASDGSASGVTKVIRCPCWGVMGHWRTYKSGKKVWIAPYRKGKERNNPKAYVPKEYVKEEE